MPGKYKPFNFYYHLDKLLLIFFFDRLSKALGPYRGDESDPRGPNYRFTAHPQQQVHSIAATDKFLITGTVGEICGWDWRVACSNKVSKIKVSWTIQIPTIKYVFN